ncbi:MAG: carbohydrate ABC transporter permease [Planctomycetota bacterium]
MSTAENQTQPDSERKAPAPRTNRYFGKLAGASAMHLLLAVIALTLVLPFVWMVLTSFKPLEEVEADSWIPTQWLWENYAILFGSKSDDIQYKGLTYGRWYWNSLFVAMCVTFLQVLTSALAAFSFARLKWAGRDKVFLLYLCTMMLPALVMMIPNYQIMISLGLVDTYAGLIIPAAFTAFGTFLLRQFMLTIPSSLDEAAEIDGASKWRLFWDVILPLTRPGLITLTIFTFISTYQSFFWPLVMLKSTHRYTLPVGLLFFDSSSGQETNVLMAAITLSVIPMIVVFVLLQKHLVKGIQLGAVKG